MATLAYVLLPLSGIAAFLGGGSVRTRLHGLQAILFGTVWPLGLYGASSISSTMTKLVFAAGVLIWAVLLVGTLAGRDPIIPGLRGVLRRGAAGPLNSEG
jgi:hypothetical protein